MKTSNQVAKLTHHSRCTHSRSLLLIVYHPRCRHERLQSSCTPVLHKVPCLSTRWRNIVELKRVDRIFNLLLSPFLFVSSRRLSSNRVDSYRLHFSPLVYSSRYLKRNDSFGKQITNFIDRYFDNSKLAIYEMKS